MEYNHYGIRKESFGYNQFNLRGIFFPTKILCAPDKEPREFFKYYFGENSPESLVLIYELKDPKDKDKISDYVKGVYSGKDFHQETNPDISEIELVLNNCPFLIKVDLKYFYNSLPTDAPAYFPDLK